MLLHVTNLSIFRCNEEKGDIPKMREHIPAAADWLVNFLNTPTKEAIRAEILYWLREPDLEKRLWNVAGAVEDAQAQGLFTQRYQPVTFKPGKSRLEPGQGVYKIGPKRITFHPWRLSDSTAGTAFAALAHLLVNAKLDRLRKCEVCKCFYFAQHKLKLVCSDECAKTKNRQGAPGRMRLFRQRQKRAEAEAKKQRKKAEQRAGLLKIETLLRKPEVIRGFAGGPSQREKTRKKLLGFVQSARSVDEFFKYCSKAEEMVLNKHL
jgi:hypothetical protein